MSAERMLLLICGPSGSGKSTLATAVLEQAADAAVIRQDDYFTQPFLPYSARVDDSFETAQHIDWDKLSTDTAAQEAPVVVLEGHMVATQHQRMWQLCQAHSRRLVCVVLQSSLVQCKQRRLFRRPRSDEDIAELKAYIEQYMWPAYLSHGVAAIEQLESTRESPIVTIDTTDGRTAEEYLLQVLTACDKGDNK